ncbi:HlyD family efflux transporter periplasmic adaptor subunit [Paralimibaculum aggregatum]|uniref:HlyD family efflux transporter periplasmic adaptor subunit n=1 Tax=Paralimibaculum aggregatum TaxID=3036245 RepID=A0ABQ6LIW5_9RHOB|nr:HlyD family efflux transporter periplasmic adaptor subunit [Limibaculum sp. NKW23]GMG82089.1 HlyD family efflux transporter periplasmic adaptor subunit [Limibaculum sp. NKW23]
MQVKQILALGAAALLAGAGYLIFGLNPDPLPDDIASGNGRIEAVQIDIATKTAGRVAEILVREGDLVQPGDHVATIDTASLQARYLAAKADIASAESDVAAARASIAEANARLVLAEQELKRATRLVERGHAAQEALDIRISQRDAAIANVAAAEATLLSRERDVDAANASAAAIKTDIDDATLVAPTVGRVLYRLAEPGEVLASGGKVLTLVDLSDIYMEVFLPLAQAHRASFGAEARIMLDIFDFFVPATVSFVSPESQFTPKEVETRSEREKLMFRVKVRVPEELVLAHIDKVKTGVRGVAYIRLAPQPEEDASPWPEFLRKPPPDADQTAVGGN